MLLDVLGLNEAVNRLVAGSNPARGANKNKDLSQIADRLRTLENSFWQQPWQRRADFGGGAYIKRVMLPNRSRSSRGRPLNAPAAFIHPCQPTVASRPPSGAGWAHELAAQSSCR